MLNGKDLVREFQKKKQISCDPMISVIRYLGDYISVVEIGVARGLGMWYMLNSCPNISHAYGIDPWLGEKGRSKLRTAAEILRQNIGKRLSLMIDTSEHAARRFDEYSLDYVFIDGDHSYEACKSDLETWYPKVRKGGVVAGHDYWKGSPSVMRAVDEFRKENLDGDRSIHMMHYPGNTCWYFYKV